MHEVSTYCLSKVQESEDTDLPPDVCLRGVTEILSDPTKGHYYVIKVRIPLLSHPADGHSYVIMVRSTASKLGQFSVLVCRSRTARWPHS